MDKSVFDSVIINRMIGDFVVIPLQNYSILVPFHTYNMKYYLRVQAIATAQQVFIENRKKGLDFIFPSAGKIHNKEVSTFPQAQDNQPETPKSKPPQPDAIP